MTKRKIGSAADNVEDAAAIEMKQNEMQEPSAGK